MKRLLVLFFSLVAVSDMAVGAAIESPFIVLDDDTVVLELDLSSFVESHTSDAGVTSLSFVDDLTSTIPQFDPATAGGRRVFKVTADMSSMYGLFATSTLITPPLGSFANSVHLGDIELALLVNGEPLFSLSDDTGGMDSCRTSGGSLIPFRPGSCEALASLDGVFDEQIVMGPDSPFVGNGTFDFSFEMAGEVSRGDLPTPDLVSANFFSGGAFWNGGLLVFYELPEPGSIVLVLLGVAGLAMRRR